MWSRWNKALLATVAVCAPTTTTAQAYQCRAPSVSSVPAISPDSKPRSLPVTGYTMALSWSPEF